MRKASAVLLAAMMCVAMFAGTASAAKKGGGSPSGSTAPKFHSVTSSVDSAGRLVVSFDERGLGHGNIDYRLTADASYLYACINGGQKNPSAANKRTINSTVNANGSFESKNGRVVASMRSALPSPGDFSCPNGQKLTLVSVSYTNVVLTDTTNNVSATAPNASRTFLTL